MRFSSFRAGFCVSFCVGGVLLFLGEYRQLGVEAYSRVVERQKRGRGETRDTRRFLCGIRYTGYGYIHTMYTHTRIYAYTRDEKPPLSLSSAGREAFGALFVGVSRMYKVVMLSCYRATYHAGFDDA